MIYKCSGNTDSGSGTEAVKRIVNFYLRPNQRQQKGGQQRQKRQEMQRQEMQGQEMQGQKRPWEQEDMRLFLNKKAKKNVGKEGGEKAGDRGTSGQGAGNQRGGEKARDRGTSGQGAGNKGSGNVFHINNYNCTNHYSF